MENRRASDHTERGIRCHQRSTLYADDAGIEPMSLGKPAKMMIVPVCSAFGLTVPEKRTEMSCSCAAHNEEIELRFDVGTSVN